MALSTGCANTDRIPQLQTVTDYIYEPCPIAEKLLAECPAPDLSSIETNGDLEAAFGEAILALDTCNEDKIKIQEAAQAAECNQ